MFEKIHGVLYKTCVEKRNNFLILCGKNSGIRVLALNREEESAYVLYVTTKCLNIFNVYRWGAQWYPCTRLWTERKRQSTPWVWPPNAWRFSTVSSGLATASPSWILLQSPAYLLVSVNAFENFVFLFCLILFYIIFGNLCALVCHSFPRREFLNSINEIEVNPRTLIDEISKFSETWFLYLLSTWACLILFVAVSNYFYLFFVALYNFRTA